jgi:hypothetical protein
MRSTTLTSSIPFLACLALIALSGSAWAGEAPAADVAKAQQAIAAALAAKDDGVPAWVKDPSLDGVLPESAYGSGEDAGCAVMSGLIDLARMREARIAAVAKSGAGNTALESAGRSTTAVSFGPIKVQALLKDFVREGDITGNKPATTCSEISERVISPQYTCKHWCREEGELGRSTASWIWEWSSPAPVTGAQVAAGLADQGVMVAAVAPLGERADAAAWVLCLPAAGIAKPAGPGHLLPYQAVAVAIVGALKRAGADILPGADVTRPETGVLEVSWPQGAAHLTIRQNAEGQVVGLTARQQVDAHTRALVELARESLTVALGQVTVERTPSGERWR